ncbi:MAG: MMPL family transporter [Euryarchaeota archaeon]|nr:MMPL family transporter [Euryarchaeota archaeon]
MSEGGGKRKPSVGERLKDLWSHSRARTAERRNRIIATAKGFDPIEFSKSTAQGFVEAPQAFRREFKRSGYTGILTAFPLFMVVISLVITSFFVWHSGFMDVSEESDMPWQIKNEKSLVVNGSLDVYLPDGDPVSNAIKEVQEDWSTNVMIIYVESEGQNITDEAILQQFDKVEKTLNPLISDPSDDVIYVLSLSTLIKEVNSSSARVTQAFIHEVGELGCQGDDDPDCLTRDLASGANSSLEDVYGVMGSYSIPSQTTIDQIINNLYDEDGSPTPGMDKLAQDIEGSGGQPDGILDRAVIIIAVSEDKSAKEIIDKTTAELKRVGLENNWDCDEEIREVNDPMYCDGNELHISMTLTGPVPITNTVTEFTFALFWKIFPIAIILVAAGLFVFHSDILQTGTWHPLQGLKVVIISGLPTLCSVFITLGMIGYIDYEVTMTIIIVGPILLALGVSYGLHITNRYAEESGSKREKMRMSIESTGKAVFLSAVTTIIGFISLTFTPMRPIATIGFALSGGIVAVWVMTMLMVPNLTILLDLKKPSHPPLKAFDVAVDIPIKWNYAVIAIFMVAILVSATWGQDNVEENIDLLGMAPEGEDAVIKMKQYSNEFNAGQVGMILVKGNVTGDLQDDDTENDDPFRNLRGISELEKRINTVEYSTGVSVVFLMKAVGVQVNFSTEEQYQAVEEILNILPMPDEIREISEIIFNRSESEDATFWNVLLSLDSVPGNEATQIFLLNVFYDSLTDETRSLFVSGDYGRSLIYVDMPFLPVKETQGSVGEINEYSEQTYADGNIESGKLTGVAAVAIVVNKLIVSSQWSSLAFAVILTLITLGIVFRDLRFAIWTTSPVVATVALQWLVMAVKDVSLSLVTVMIGSILVGVGVDFSIHISNRIRELGGGIDAIRLATVSTGMSLFEAATVTTLGLATAYLIPIPEIKPFITVIIILLWIAAASALFLLPAIFVTLEKLGIGTTGGSDSMKRALGLMQAQRSGEIAIDAVMVTPTSNSSDEAW